MTNFAIAQSANRVEDDRLLTGRGRYTDDIVLPQQLYGVLVRSPHAHARIRRIDAASALADPRVKAVYTFDDLKAAGVGPLPCGVPLKNRDGTGRADPPHPVLADGVARHVGDGVAFVVAESAAAARDAADAVVVDYEMLPAITDLAQALDADAPLVWPDLASNRVFDWETGDRAKTEELFAGAAHRVELTLVNQRIAVAAMETRACNASWDATTERLTLWSVSQGVFLLRNTYAAMLGMKPEQLHVLTPDVGGSFGAKIFPYAEPVLCLFATRQLGHPVKWTSERGEAFLTDTQGRDNLSTGELAIDAQGNFLAVRVRTIAGMGAYLSTYAPMIPTSAGSRVLPSIYKFQAMSAQVQGVFTHSTPVDAYRGAGRPEANYLVERLIDVAARRLKRDPIDLRRQNFIPPDALPWTSAAKQIYDSGAFAGTMDKALMAADIPGFKQRQTESQRRGKLRGLGVACYVEATGGGAERAEIRFAADGQVDVLVGTQSSGQGHETAYTQLVHDKLGVPPERIRIVQGDSDVLASGGGTGGARSLYVEGTAILGAVDGVIEKGRAAASNELEAAAADIVFERGTFRIVGTDRQVGLLDLAQDLKVDDGVPGPLDTAFDHKGAVTTYPNGCHVCEVEIDEATGGVEVVRYTVADDFGRVVNPKIARGQVHGGIGQGIGQALMEGVAWSEDGQPLTGSFNDYAIPRAEDVSAFEVVFNEDAPCKTNPLGAKGAGEAGSVGSCPAVVNAVVAALADRGVEHVDMPVTAEKLWRLLRS